MTRSPLRSRSPKNWLFASGVAALMIAGAPAAAAAQDRHDASQQETMRSERRDGDHQGWGADRGQDHAYRRGERMGYNDWSAAPVVDYRSRHLRRPKRGYEWREHNGRYILAEIATGAIASVVLGRR